MAGSSRTGFGRTWVTTFREARAARIFVSRWRWRFFRRLPFTIIPRSPTRFISNPEDRLPERRRPELPSPECKALAILVRRVAPSALPSSDNGGRIPVGRDYAEYEDNDVERSDRP